MALHDTSYSSDAPEPSKPSNGKTGGALIILIVVLGFVLALIFVPGIWGHMQNLFPKSSSRKMNPSVVVWADKLSGNYYCAGSRPYGRPPGTYMKQGDALTLGFQPLFGKYCQDTQGKHYKEVNKK